MAGFRTFATGEVLTAANVNDFLMGQSVMRFADADARTAALGADVVEGMLTYNLDTDQLEVFDGTNFVVAAPEPPAGIGSNVVNLESNVSFSTSSSTFVDLTNSTLSFTPSSATSKVLVIFRVLSASNNTNGRGMQAVINADGTDVSLVLEGVSNPGGVIFQGSLSHLNEPSTTSPVTYKVRVNRRGDGTLTINSFSMTIIEVAA